MSRDIMLRDHFAAFAMQGLISNYGQSVAWDEIAHDAYRIADAMLDERNGTSITSLDQLSDHARNGEREMREMRAVDASLMDDVS